MKFKNIFAVALATMALASCTDDDKTYPINTAPGVTVEMGETEITVVENQGLFNVPIIVNGNPDGYIEVTVKVRDGEWDDEKETEPAIDDANYYITTKKLRIAPDTKTAYIEVNTQDDGDVENYTRVFYMSIESAVGASVVSADDFTQINIKNKSLFNKMSGTWYLSYTDMDGVQKEDKCVMVAIDPKERHCYLSGVMGLDWVTTQFEFNYDKETEVVNLNLVYGYVAATGLNFGSFTGDFVPCSLTGSNVGSLPGLVNEDRDKVEFLGDKGFMMGVYASGTYMGYYDILQDVMMSRTPASQAK